MDGWLDGLGKLYNLHSCCPSVISEQLGETKFLLQFIRCGWSLKLSSGSTQDARFAVAEIIKFQIILAKSVQECRNLPKSNLFWLSMKLVSALMFPPFSLVHVSENVWASSFIRTSLPGSWSILEEKGTKHWKRHRSS